MKKGFTMIELIFVIVILGILAAVAIPRLAATRDDAEISKAASNVATAVSDIGAYYTAQGEFAANWDDMTKVGSGVTGAAAQGTAPAKGAVVHLKVKNKDCVSFGLDNNGTLYLGRGTGATDAICVEFYKIDQYSDLAAAGTDIVYHFGGSGIKR